MAGWENRINAYLEDVCCRSPEGWDWKMMETCASKIYNKPVIIVVDYGVDGAICSISPCKVYSCLIGGQEEASGASYVFYYDSNDDGTYDYIIWYYKYSTTLKPDDLDETYTSTLMSAFKWYWSTQGYTSYSGIIGYSNNNGTESLTDWHITAYNGTDSQYSS